jgi:hypothetical protein
MREKAMSEGQRREELAKLQGEMAKLRIDAEKAKRQGVNVSITGDQLAQYPGLSQWLDGFIEDGTIAQNAQPQQQQTQESTEQMA